VSRTNEAATDPVREYIERGSNTVDGWFERVDAELFLAINDIQAAEHLCGGLLEIGVYLGKSAILLGYLRAAGETLVVCDPFKPEALNDGSVHYADLTRRAFEDSYRRFHRDLPEVYGVVSSGLVNAAGLSRTLRFIHVDGSHEYVSVAEDIEIVREVMTNGGVAVFDDIYSRHTVGVQAAVWEAIARQALAPFAITADKIYVTQPGHVTAWLDALKAYLAEVPGFEVVVHRLSHNSILQVVHYQRVPFLTRVKRGITPPAIARRLG
jgi:predicted O-methyltransferase YrrM